MQPKFTSELIEKRRLRLIAEWEVNTERGSEEVGSEDKGRTRLSELAGYISNVQPSVSSHTTTKLARIIASSYHIVGTSNRSR
jgi:hypothetical protein